MIQRAQEIFFEKFCVDLRRIVWISKDVFCIYLCSDPSVKVPPMVARFEEKKRFVKSIQRTYSPDNLKFLKKKCDELMKLGFVYHNPSSKWAYAPLIVPKDGAELFRFSNDLCPFNAQTKTSNWSLPHIDALIAQLIGAKKISCLTSSMAINSFLCPENRKNVSRFTLCWASSRLPLWCMAQQTPLATFSRQWSLRSLYCNFSSGCVLSSALLECLGTYSRYSDARCKSVLIVAWSST